MKKTVCLILTLVLALALSITAFADVFTPSAEQKGAPEIIPQQSQGGETYIAIIKKSSGEEVIGVPTAYLIVTPISKMNTANIQIKNRLQFTENQFAVSSNIGEVVPAFNAALKKIAPDKDPNNFVVRDLFDVTLEGSYETYLQSHNTITIVFNVGAAKGTPVIPLKFVTDTQKWEVVDSSNYVVNDNGTVAITMEELGVFAFSVESTEARPNSPQTSNTTVVFQLIGAALTLVGTALVVSANNKRTKKVTSK